MLTYTVSFVPDNAGSDIGWLCVALASPDFDRPVMVTGHYPVVRCHRSQHEEEIGRPAQNAGIGVYRVTMGFGSHLLYLTSRGDTLPILTTETPIPAPKRAKETRYLYGRWEKWTSGKGWTAAY